MAITTFVRKEKKYLITKEQRDSLLQILPKYMVFDKFCQNGNKYTVNNIYFDTPTFNVIRHSISKPVYKAKIRIRSYITEAKDTDIAFLEMKKKFNSMRIAEKETDISHVDISRCCRGVSETAGGYKWEPYNNQDKENENDGFLGL